MAQERPNIAVFQIFCVEHGHVTLFGWNSCVAEIRRVCQVEHEPAGYRPHFVDSNACNRLQCLPAQSAMIGDSQRRDRDGPTEFGIQGHFLNREGSGDFSSITDFAQMVINSLDV